MRGQGPLQIGVTSPAINLVWLCPLNRKYFTCEGVGGGRRAAVEGPKPTQISGTVCLLRSLLPRPEGGCVSMAGTVPVYVFIVINCCSGTWVPNGIDAGDCFDEQDLRNSKPNI